MAMMAGRVLLVCALCVLWCGAGGCAEESAGEVLPGASGGGAGSLQESQRIVPEVLKNSDLKASDIKDKTEETLIKVPLTEQGEISDDDEGEDEEEGPSPPTPPKGGGVQPQTNNGKLKTENESEPQKENQRHVEVERQNPSEKETVDDEAEGTNEKEAIGLQPQHQKIPVQEQGTRNVESDQPTQGNEGQTIVEEITPHNPAGDHSSGEHKGSDGSKEMEEVEEGGVEGHEGGNERHRDQVREEAAHAAGAPKLNSTDIKQEVQRTHAGETPTGIKQKAEEEKGDETEEEREQQKEQNQENPPGKEQEFTSGANATNQIITTPGDSDSSTAVSHTTTPLLLLLAVACAAAAVVAA
ncbi:mucin-associated surface protein (MASP) [Trypanosoma cruzi Dm28c]|uniref:Mucin-associated surface protein (MASP) n=2 Tax=Trypanosoma cruzi TaxID=5693 RepID=V5CXH4_TRYCR|nr:mucin-associated surface protein (MASP) [Trypanosoma cruzi Dm28c]PBJ77452.1 mucin-associated surface protein [Trypanosoma cruzi cruzi]PWU89728.1 Mucin-associated surface protein (MASP) [Trypanosoma cruzi]